MFFAVVARAQAAVARASRRREPIIPRAHFGARACATSFVSQKVALCVGAVRRAKTVGLARAAPILCTRQKFASELLVGGVDCIAHMKEVRSEE